MTAGDTNPTNWSYGRCPLETAPGSFGPFAGIVRTWRAKWPAGDALPARAAFDFPDFRGWWGRIAIARIRHDPFEVRFQLWGTQLAYWWGVDYTGRTLGEASPDPAAWLNTEGRYFEAMAQSPFIGVAWGGLEHYRRGGIRVMSVDLPLAEAGGVSHVLMAHREIGPGDAQAAIMPELDLRDIRP